MDETYSLSSYALKWILTWVIGMNGEVIEVDGELLYFAIGYHGVSLEVSPEAIDSLAEDLWLPTILPIHIDELLATVTIMASQVGPRVKGEVALGRRLNAEFAIACAVYLAFTRSYVIDFNKLPWSEIDGALYPPNRPILTRIFQESLGLGQYYVGTGWSEVTGVFPGHDESTWLVRCFEEKFDHRFLYQDAIIAENGRELSAESLSNLRSVAELENWPPETVLALIEEHLYPTLDPDLVYHNVTISGADWRRLYVWMLRSGRLSLWTVLADLQRRSSPLLCVMCPGRL